MTSKEALEILVKQANERKLSNKIVANGIAVSLLEKLVERDTGKKVIKDCDGMFRCPSCDGYVSDNVNDGYGSYEELFCDHCGQRLDWSKL